MVTSWQSQDIVPATQEQQQQRLTQLQGILTPLTQAHNPTRESDLANLLTAANQEKTQATTDLDRARQDRDEARAQLEQARQDRQDADRTARDVRRERARIQADLQTETLRKDRAQNDARAQRAQLEAAQEQLRLETELKAAAEAAARLANQNADHLVNFGRRIAADAGARFVRIRNENERLAQTADFLRNVTADLEADVDYLDESLASANKEVGIYRHGYIIPREIRRNVMNRPITALERLPIPHFVPPWLNGSRLANARWLTIGCLLVTRADAKHADRVLFDEWLIRNVYPEAVNSFDPQVLEDKKRILLDCHAVFKGRRNDIVKDLSHVIRDFINNNGLREFRDLFEAHDNYFPPRQRDANGNPIMDPENPTAEDRLFVEIGKPDTLCFIWGKVLNFFNQETLEAWTHEIFGALMQSTYAMTKAIFQHVYRDQFIAHAAGVKFSNAKPVELTDLWAKPNVNYYTRTTTGFLNDHVALNRANMFSSNGNVPRAVRNGFVHRNMNIRNDEIADHPWIMPIPNA